MVENQRRMGGIQTPEWLAFAVYFYPGLVFGNLLGFRDPAAKYLGTLSEVFHRLCTQAGIANWRSHVFVGHGGWVYAGLRKLLQLLRIPVHSEVVSGLSYRRMASLDVFVATHTGAMGMEPPSMALWNASDDVKDGITYFPKQDHWWHMPVWRSVGQADSWNLMDYQVDLRIPPHVQGVLAVMERHARTGDEVTRRRIGTMLRHLSPDVLLPGAQMAALRPLTFNEGQRGIRPIRDRRMLEDEEKRDASL